MPSGGLCLSLPTLSVGFLWPLPKYNSWYTLISGIKILVAPKSLSGQTPSHASILVFLQSFFLIGSPAPELPLKSCPRGGGINAPPYTVRSNWNTE